jgi:hypothetical protein
MGAKTRAAQTKDFCLVLSPDRSAHLRASEALRERFRLLAEETRRKLVAVVAELVDDAVARRCGWPIRVTVVLGRDSIRGEVADQADLVAFEIPLA